MHVHLRQAAEDVLHLMEYIETQLRQILREGEAAGGPRLAVNETAQLLLAFVEGRIAQYVRSGFKTSPVEAWEKQWELLGRGALRV